MIAASKTQTCSPWWENISQRARALSLAVTWKGRALLSLRLYTLKPWGIKGKGASTLDAGLDRRACPPSPISGIRYLCNYQVCGLGEPFMLGAR